ncbi:DUF3014 domain-containing protein [Thalassotalea sp. PLHSN55]|uniref:DUF3014 domain-containing protein n=1 Tax=Thalassotalea sp. PLHSN55 TaxID=3435888 RepID=UPI003F828E5C
MENSTNSQNQTPWAVIVTIIAIVVAVVVWQLLDKEPEPEPVEIVEVVEEVLPEPEVIEPEIIEEPIVIEEPEPELVEPEVVEVKEPLPALNESDVWVQEKLPNLTWRKELLKLVINEDMIRRFVVFTDNFSQGLVAYEHSPFINPATSFSAQQSEKADNNSEQQWLWDEKSTRRFSLYVDLLRSIDTDTLVQWYVEMKPLIDEAYQELGYPDEEFTDTLQFAITRVLDMDIPKDTLVLTRPSVMYQFADQDLENLDATDKLLLRLGRENLLVIKSILLEINEKLSRAVN